MNDIQKNRLKNANDILRSVCEGKTKLFAERISRTPSYVSTYISGKTPKAISDKVAHTIEVAFGLPTGRLDEIAPILESTQNSSNEPIFSKKPSTPNKGFNLSMFPEIQAGIAAREHVNKLINKSDLEAQIPEHLNRIGAINFVSDMMKKAAMEMDILARELRLDVMLESIANIKKELESIGLHVESQNFAETNSISHRLCRTLLVKDQWQNKKYLITVAGLHFGYIVDTLKHEYNALINNVQLSNDIDGAFTIILRENDDVIGGLIPFVFENKELSNFDALKNHDKSESKGVNINFNNTLRFVTEGILEIKSVEVLFGKKPQRVAVTLNSQGKPQPLKTIIESDCSKLLSSENTENEIISLSGSLYRKDIREDLAIDSIAYAYQKITEKKKFI